MKETEILKLLPIEDRAKMEKKEIPFGITLVIFVVGLCSGLYYWFVDELLFEYWDISPFWGFVVFLLGGVIIDFVLSWAYSLYWSEYNNLIKEANDEIADLIKKGEGTPEELFRLKKELIERKIGKETLSKEEFLWHTSKYCWGCGKIHTQPTKTYLVHKERTESWKEGAIRHTKTFTKDSYINICPDCYSRLMSAEKQDNKNAPWVIALAILLGIGACTGSYYLWGEKGFFICLAIIFFCGFYVLLFISGLLLYPFLKHEESSTKWSFDEIPEIRRFMNHNHH